MDISNNKSVINTIRQVELPSVEKQTLVAPQKSESEQVDSVITQAQSLTTKDESDQKLQGAVSQINDYVQNLQRSFLFTVDEASGKDVVTVLDSETKKVIRQYPSEEVLEIARRLAAEKEEELSLFSSRI